MSVCCGSCQDDAPLSGAYLASEENTLPILDEEPAIDRTQDLEQRLKATELERDDIHREMMDLRYQLELAKAA